MLDTIFEIYKNGLALGITTALIVMPLFLIIGIVRFVKKYAYAQRIDGDDATDSSFVCRGLWCMEIFADGKSIKDDRDIQKPIGADWRGTLLDIGLSGGIFILLGILWPVAIPCIALWLPVQTMHNYHIKKKEFLKKLKEGEERA